MSGDASRLRALDGLRGLAVAAVVAFHFGHFPGGWLGVDAFFTLSGFLITSLLLGEVARAGRVDLRGFWRRRVRRLQPAAIVCVTAVVASAAWWAQPGTGRAIRGEALAALTSVMNWYLLWAHRPYAAGTSPSAFEHFWSLAIEEQFYVVWPLVIAAIVAAARHRSRLGIALAAAAGIVVSWTLLAMSGLQPGYLGTFPRMGSLLAGALLACVLPLHGHDRRVAGARVIGAAGLVGIVALWCVAGWPPHAPLAVILPAHAMCMVAVIIGATNAPSPILQWQPLAKLGLVSYGVYLWHWPIIVIVTPERLGRSELATDVVRLVLIALFTVGSWRLIERPVRHEHRLRVTRFALPVAAAFAVGVVFVGAGATDPAPVWARATGELVHATTPVATIKRPPQFAKRVLVVGDSIPTSLLAGTDASGASLQVGAGRLLEQFATRGITAMSTTLTGCPVVDEVIVGDDAPRAACPVTLRRALDKALSVFHPQLVVWYSSAEAYEVQHADGSRHDPLTEAAEAAALRKRYADRIAWFGRHGARVALVSPGPARDGENVVDLRRDSMKSMRFLDEQLHMVASENPRAVVAVVEMGDLVCPNWRTTGHCADAMFGGGHFRESDGEHFDGNGAIVAGQWLVDRVARVNLHP